MNSNYNMESSKITWDHTWEMRRISLSYQSAVITCDTTESNNKSANLILSPICCSKIDVNFISLRLVWCLTLRVNGEVLFIAIEFHFDWYAKLFQRVNHMRMRWSVELLPYDKIERHGLVLIWDLTYIWMFKETLSSLWIFRLFFRVLFELHFIFLSPAT